MNATEKACIEWSKKVGVVCEPEDPNAIHFWRAQCLKFDEELEELNIELKKGGKDGILNELGDCIFVINNLLYIAGLKSVDEAYDDGNSSILHARREAIRFSKPTVFIGRYYRDLCKIATRIAIEDGIVVNERAVLAKTLAKNEARTGHTIHGNYIKDKK